MIRVFIADDHGIVREAISNFISGIPDLEVAGEARNGEELIQKIKESVADVLVFNLPAQGKHGLGVLSKIKELKPNLEILYLSLVPADQYTVQVMRAGANGVLSKDAVSTDLEKAIRTLAAGRKFVTEKVAEQLAVFVSSPHSLLRHELLSDREFQVLLMIASGKTVTEIAETLSLSVKTISTYRTRILEKMQLRTNAELIYYVVSNHLDK